VHVIACIVPIEAGDSFASVSRSKCVEKGLCRRGSKNFAHRYGVTHVLAEIPDESRFVSGTASGHYTDFARNWRPDVFEDTRIIRSGDEMRMRLGEALEHFFDHEVWIVDDSLHKGGLLIKESLFNLFDPIDLQRRWTALEICSQPDVHQRFC